MKNAYSAFMAFFIPFSAAILMLYFSSYIITQIPKDTFIDEKGNSWFISDSYTPLDGGVMYVLFIGCLFILSVVLPFFVASRSEPIERTEIKLMND